MTIHTIEELKKRIEDLGWTISSEEDNQYMLTKYSPAGQEFNVDMNGETVEELIESIDEAHENFDVSYETYLWLDDTGHGRYGAPYEMKDVLADMEACEEMIKDLHDNIINPQTALTMEEFGQLIKDMDKGELKDFMISYAERIESQANQGKVGISLLEFYNDAYLPVIAKNAFNKLNS